MRTFGRKVRLPGFLFRNQALSYRGLMFSTFLKLSFVIKEMNKEGLNLSKQSPASLRLKPRNNVCRTEYQSVPATRNSSSSLYVIKSCWPSHQQRVLPSQSSWLQSAVHLCSAPVTGSGCDLVLGPKGMGGGHLPPKKCFQWGRTGERAGLLSITCLA